MMRIDKKANASPTQAPQAQPIRQRKVNPTRAEPKTDASDAVEISEAARARQVATDALKQMPPVRTEKVERLKRAIKTGSYRVSAQDLAKKLLDDQS